MSNFIIKSFCKVCVLNLVSSRHRLSPGLEPPELVSRLLFFPLHYLLSEWALETKLRSRPPAPCLKPLSGPHLNPDSCPGSIRPVPGKMHQGKKGSAGRYLGLQNWRQEILGLENKHEATLVTARSEHAQVCWAPHPPSLPRSLTFLPALAT